MNSLSLGGAQVYITYKKKEFYSSKSSNFVSILLWLVVGAVIIWQLVEWHLELYSSTNIQILEIENLFKGGNFEHLHQYLLDFLALNVTSLKKDHGKGVGLCPFATANGCTLSSILVDSTNGNGFTNREAALNTFNSSGCGSQYTMTFNHTNHRSHHLYEFTSTTISDPAYCVFGWNAIQPRMAFRSELAWGFTKENSSGLGDCYDFVLQGCEKRQFNWIMDFHTADIADTAMGYTKYQDNLIAGLDTIFSHATLRLQIRPVLVRKYDKYFNLITESETIVFRVERLNPMIKINTGGNHHLSVHIEISYDAVYAVVERSPQSLGAYIAFLGGFATAAFGLRILIRAYNEHKLRQKLGGISLDFEALKKLVSQNENDFKKMQDENCPKDFVFSPAGGSCIKREKVI